MVWRDARPIEVVSKRSNGEGSPVCRAKVFGILLEEKVGDFIWISDPSPLGSLFGRSVVSGNFELGDH